MLSPHDPNIVWLGGNRLFKSYNRGDNWTASEDLTKNIDRRTVAVMGVPGDKTMISKADGIVNYSTIISISESPVQPGVVWAGTDDGNLQVSQDGGKTFTEVGKNISGLPANHRYWISRIEAGHFDMNTAYVSVDGHRSDDLKPYVFVTRDYGQTFQSITTGIFVDYLKKHLPGAETQIPLAEWLTQPGIPASAPRPASDAFTKVSEQAKRWASGETPAAKIDTTGWTTHEWLHFLKALPQQMTPEKMAELDRAFKFTQTGNSEILDEWLLIAVRNHYEPAYPRLEEFLISVGRRKYVKPLYTEMAKTPEGKARAAAIYKTARPGYHPITASTVDAILK